MDKQSKNNKASSDAEGQQAFDKPIKEKNDQGEVFWAIGGKKRVTISSFKGKTYVNIREYYEKDGQQLPGKKGISLTIQQWEELRKVVGEIDQQLAESSGSKGRKRVKKE